MSTKTLYQFIDGLHDTTQNTIFNLFLTASYFEYIQTCGHIDFQRHNTMSFEDIAQQKHQWFETLKTFDFDTTANRKGNVLIHDRNAITSTQSIAHTEHFFTPNFYPPQMLWIYQNESVTLSWIPKKLIPHVQHTLSQHKQQTPIEWIHLYTPPYATDHRHTNPLWIHLPKTKLFLEPFDTKEKIPPIPLLDFATAWKNNDPLD